MEGTGWCEVALPPLGAEIESEDKAEAKAAVSNDEEVEKEEAVYELDFRSGGGLSRGSVSRANFVPFAVGSSTAAQRLVVFEDAGVFHRTPLTAYALPDLQAGRQRPMARVVFYGANSLGDAVRFEQPARAVALSPTATAAALPTGLRRALEAYAASQPQLELTDALDLYLRGDAELVRFLESDGAGTSISVAAPASLRDRERWASAPELGQMLGEIIGTREQVLACLRLQDQYRSHMRSLESDGAERKGEKWLFE